MVNGMFAIGLRGVACALSEVLAQLELPFTVSAWQIPCVMMDVKGLAQGGPQLRCQTEFVTT